MPLTGVINVDEITAQATLELTDDLAQLVTQYTYLVNRVTAPPRPQAVEFILSDFVGFLDLVGNFGQLVDRRLRPSRTALGTFKYTFDKNAVAGNLELLITLGGTEMKAEWKRSTNRVEFSPVLALDVSWADFLLFLRLHREMLRQVRDF